MRAILRSVAVGLGVLVACPVMGAHRAPAATVRVGTAAPEFAAHRWLNLAPDAPAPTLSALRGQVVLVEFWTFGCINCRHVEPHVRSWHVKYARQGLSVIGIHTPELPFERNAENVARYLDQHDIRWPVALDPDFTTWRRFGNRAWPTLYLVDRHGDVRHVHVGEGGYERIEQVIRELLAEPRPVRPRGSAGM